MTQRLIFQHKYKSFGCANDVNLSFSDRLLMCKNTILIYYQHILYALTISPRSQLYSNSILGNGFCRVKKQIPKPRPPNSIHFVNSNIFLPIVIYVANAECSSELRFSGINWKLRLQKVDNIQRLKHGCLIIRPSIKLS
mgnify:CR=1 FL=1